MPSIITLSTSHEGKHSFFYKIKTWYKFIINWDQVGQDRAALDTHHDIFKYTVTIFCATWYDIYDQS